MTEYPLHFIGRGVYTPESFEAEAAKHGVARVIPKPAMHGLAWGNPVLLAVWEPPAKAAGQNLGIKGGGREGRLGIAETFGFFRVTGFNVDAASPAARDAFWSKIIVLRVTEFSEPPHVSRACGSYAVSIVAIVKDSLEHILWAAERAEAETGTKLKLAATGAFYPIAPHLRLEEVPFARTLMRVDTAGYDPLKGLGEAEEMQGGGQPLTFIRDYSRRQYIKKDDRAALGFKPQGAAA
jgi:hypothetical protein